VNVGHLCKHGEWSILALTSSELFDGDIVVVPCVDGFAVVVARSVFEIDTFGA